jgi:hypothetical protein
MFIQNLDMNGWVKESLGINQTRSYDLVNPNILTNYSTMWAQAVVTCVASYDVLLEGKIVYPLKVTLDL